MRAVLSRLQSTRVRAKGTPGNAPLTPRRRSYERGSSPQDRRSAKAKSYRDIFGVPEARKQPLVLSDCTSIEWPAGWSQEDADRWRKANGLERP
jgi:hypothetical protein